MEDLYGQLQALEPEKRAFTRKERLAATVRPLLAWYESHARCLPWREEATPYRVWISEIMLQQTRVEAVKPYFERFMDELSEVKDLAVVDDDRLMKLWEGLGYYSRAKNLKKAARIVMEDYGGELPDSREELMKLPGIGSYTAGAIASIAYGVPVPAVDGNVLRVISRVLESREDILRQSVKTGLEREIQEIMPKTKAGCYNQGLMEVGAVVCVPNGRPRCGDCPFYTICLSKRHDSTGEIPVKTPRKKRRTEERTVLILEYGDCVALRKRPDTGLLASLYELPSLEGKKSREEVAALFKVEISQVEALSEARHIFTHVEWNMTGYRVKLSKKPDEPFIFASKQEIKGKYPLPNVFLAYTKLIK